MKLCLSCGDLYDNHQPQQTLCNECRHRNCLHCGAQFINTQGARTKNKSRLMGVFCSRSCASSYRSMLVRPPPSTSLIDWSMCAVCGKAHTSNPDKRTDWCMDCRTNHPIIPTYKTSLVRARMYGRACIVCACRFTPLHNRQMYCSKKCKRASFDFKEWVRKYRISKAGKKRKRKQNATRRARKLGAERISGIDPIEILARDGWRCQVCGVYTPRKLRGSHHDRAPEMDHKVPLSAGGTHTEDNVCCCCRRCNNEKSDKIYQTDMYMGRHLNR